MTHLTSEQLSAHLDRALTGRAGEEVERHLSDCEACREALAALAAQDAALRPALTHEPDEAYFERFAERVDDRIRAAGLAKDPARGQGFDLGRWFRSPRTLAWAGAAAVVVVGAGLAFMSGREIRPPDLRDRDLAERSQQVAPGAARPMEAPPAGTVTDEATPPSATAGGERNDVTQLTKEGAAPRSQVGMVSGGAPGAGEERIEVDAKDRSRAPQTAQTRATLDRLTLAPPPPATGQASPGRAVEMKRNAAGEDVPAPRAGASAPAAPSAGAADMAQPTEPAEPSRKKLAAEPLKPGSTWGTPKALYSGRAKSESAWSGDSFARPPEAGSLEVTAPPPVPHTSYAPKQSITPAEVPLCGEVRDAAGRPVVGAQVSVADVGRTTTTDARGAFCVNAPAGEHALTVMAVGFTESRRTVRVGGDKAPVRVTLEAVSVLGEKRGVASGTPSTLRSMASEEPRDAYSGLPDTLRALVRAAQQLQTRAAARRSAGLFDAAASGWERALRRLAGGPLEVETRGHLAESRYRAWEAGPNDRRAAAAVEALTAFAVRAQAGAEREQAIRWLDQVRH